MAANHANPRQGNSVEESESTVRMARAQKALRIVRAHGLDLDRSDEDASWASNRAVEEEAADALVSELSSNQIEASTCVDQDNRSLYWVHVTMG